MNGKFVAIKMPFGELGNVSYLRPNYARAVVELVREQGGRPFLTDCNTMYPGKRKNALEHLECAWETGSRRCPPAARCSSRTASRAQTTWPCRSRAASSSKRRASAGAVMDADVFISLTHFKGHEATGFGGAIKNIGMGCGSRAGKKEQHSNGQARVNPERCRGCRRCERECANDGLVFDAGARTMTVDTRHCVGCGRCLGACNFDAISFADSAAV